MQNIQLNTSQNVNVLLIPASVGKRTLAFIIDLVAICIYCWGLINVFSQFYGFKFLNDYDDDGSFKFIILNIFLLPIYTYSLWTEFLFNGQTLGKYILGIKVIKLNGYTANFNEYFIRWVCRIIDIWTFSFIGMLFLPFFTDNWSLIAGILFFTGFGFIAFLSITTSSKNQRFGDKIAGTTVIQLKERYPISITILEEITEDYQPKYTQVLKLSDNDARIIKETFINAKKQRDAQTMLRLKYKLEEVMEIKSNEPTEIFIEKVLKDFNYYTQKM